jgi:5-methyltetrahydropteroyltriglutamate--homocysteine methyltransferase
MEPQVDDIGSFPLPSSVSRDDFDKAYRLARAALVEGKDPRADWFLSKNFCRVTIDSFKQKSLSGLDIVNYPQQYDGIKQVGDGIHAAMEKGTFVVEAKDAILPEVCILREEAKTLCEELRNPIRLRVSIFGPMEQYLREMGTVVHEDVLLQYAETVRRFAENSILNLKHIKTEVVSIDEPSFGFQNLGTSKDVLLRVLERAFDFKGVVRQIHLHSSSCFADVLEAKNTEVLSFEYAASPRNIESVTKKMLDKSDKNVRVGIARTDIDSILAELYSAGISHPTSEQLVEDENTIRKRFEILRVRFGERLAFTGPDCGLGSWPSQETASLLLRRSVMAVRNL